MVNWNRLRQTALAIGIWSFALLQRFGLYLWTKAKKNPKKSIVFGIFFLIWCFGLPNTLFKTPYSAVVEDREGNLLSARIAADGQWRFALGSEVPSHFASCLIEFEDRRFYWHPGIDPVGFGRAIVQNFKSGGVVSGGSTLTMQLMRLRQPGKSRSFLNKITEMFWATRAEWRYSKKELLQLYAAHAPFGGNVVGLDAACWRYFGKNAKLLSWGESAMLAVLPNNPSMLHLGRNRSALLAKRNRLLDRLKARGVLNYDDWQLAVSEPLPEKPHELPTLAPHLLTFLSTTQGNLRFSTSIQLELQAAAQAAVVRHMELLAENGIHNAAVVVTEIETGKVVAYVGNNPSAGAEHAGMVDIIQAPRSTGSTLKPFLYAKLLQDGELLPTALVPDIPMMLNGFQPENFMKTYDGMVPARTALTRSLNIPFVIMQRDYGTPPFLHFLHKVGFKRINRSAQDYGLTLIIGGAESTLWELTTAYANLARLATHYYPYQGKYDPKDWRGLSLTNLPFVPSNPIWRKSTGPVLDAAAAWATLDAMSAIERPMGEGNWELYESTRTVAWKTGTSQGFRDAWAIGVTPRFAVGVWVGNADGEGRPGLTGIDAAAPLMFDIFRLLPPDERWFDPPYDEMAQVPICKYSGYRVGPHCPVDTIWAPQAGIKMDACKWCQLVHLDPSQTEQVTSDCVAPADMVHEPWFVLQPMYEHYYKPRHADYRIVPPMRFGCGESDAATNQMIEIIYPHQSATLYVPLELDGRRGQIISRASSRQSGDTLRWFLDDQFLGQTIEFHEMMIQPPPGQHILAITDLQGRRDLRQFLIK
jgi:penicillin-binding protein 1C